jgi:hypothetical protein
MPSLDQRISNVIINNVASYLQRNEFYPTKSEAAEKVPNMLGQNAHEVAYVRKFINNMGPSYFYASAFAKGKIVDLCGDEEIEGVFVEKPSYVNKYFPQNYFTPSGILNNLDNYNCSVQELACHCVGSITYNGEVKATDNLLYRTGSTSEDCLCDAVTDKAEINDLNKKNNIYAFKRTVSNARQAVTQFIAEAKELGLVKEDYISYIKGRSYIVYNGTAYNSEPNNKDSQFEWFLNLMNISNNFASPAEIAEALSTSVKTCQINIPDNAYEDEMHVCVLDPANKKKISPNFLIIDTNTTISIKTLATQAPTPKPEEEEATIKPSTKVEPNSPTQKKQEPDEESKLGNTTNPTEHKNIINKTALAPKDSGNITDNRTPSPPTEAMERLEDQKNISKNNGWASLLVVVGGIALICAPVVLCIYKYKKYKKADARNQNELPSSTYNVKNVLPNIDSDHPGIEEGYTEHLRKGLSGASNDGDQKDF